MQFRQRGLDRHRPGYLGLCVQRHHLGRHRGPSVPKSRAGQGAGGEHGADAVAKGDIEHYAVCRCQGRGFLQDAGV